MKRANYKAKTQHRCGACDQKFGSGPQLIEHIKVCNEAAILTEVLDNSMGIMIDRTRSKRSKA
jgi:hypothetical protein